jgi:hypothetical protein
MQSKVKLRWKIELHTITGSLIDELEVLKDTILLAKEPFHFRSDFQRRPKCISEGMGNMYSSIRSKISHLVHILVRFQNRFTIYLSISGFRHPIWEPIQLERLGSDYGGWWVPKSSILPSNKKILVSAGLGFDVSFDKLMLEDGYFVIGLDPLARSYLYASEELKGYGNKLLINKGVSTFDGRQKFYAPKIPSHDSWSMNSQVILM